MKSIRLNQNEFILNDDVEKVEFKLPGNYRKDNDVLRHVTKVIVFRTKNNNVLACLKTDIKSVESFNKWITYKDTL